MPVADDIYKQKPFDSVATSVQTVHRAIYRPNEAKNNYNQQHLHRIHDMNGSERLRIVAEKYEKRTFLRHFWAQNR